MTLDLRVSSGTYVRSIAEALGGHCMSLRRTEVGPFRVEEADDREACARCSTRRSPASEGHAREAELSEAVAPRAADGPRRSAVRIAHSPGQLERQPRAVAIGTFDGVHRGHRAVVQAAIDTGLAATVITFDPHPRIALGNHVELITTLERRLELLADAGAETTLVAGFTPELMALSRRSSPNATFARSGRRPSRQGPTFASARGGAAISSCSSGWDSRCWRCPRYQGVSSSAVRHALHDGDVAGAAAMLGRPYELDGVVVAGDQRGGTLGYPTANLALEPHLSAPATASTREPRWGTAPPCRSGRTRTTVAPSAESSSSCSTSTVISTASGSW